MSFILEHRRLFDVSVQDGSGKGLSDFTFQPSHGARRRFTDHQLVFRGGNGGFAVFYRRNPLAAEPLLGPITGRVRFGIFCFLGQRDFFQRFEPDLTQDTGPQIYLDNLTASGDIQPQEKSTLSGADVVSAGDAMKVFPPVFSVVADMTGTAPPTKFTVRDKFDPATAVLEVPLEATPGSQQTTTKIDMSGKPSGPYTLDTDAASAAVKTIYIDNGVAAARVLGLVDLYWETNQDAAPAGGLSYVIRFRKR